MICSIGVAILNILLMMIVYLIIVTYPWITLLIFISFLCFYFIYSFYYSYRKLEKLWSDKLWERFMPYNRNSNNYSFLVTGNPKHNYLFSCRFLSKGNIISINKRFLFKKCKITIDLLEFKYLNQNITYFDFLKMSEENIHNYIKLNNIVDKF